MIFRKMIKILGLIISFSILIVSDSFAANNDFEFWKNSFKKRAIQSGVSKEIVEEIMSEAKFLSKVIEFDRFQPEFYEDTFTYINKRSNEYHYYWTTL